MVSKNTMRFGVVLMESSGTKANVGTTALDGALSKGFRETALGKCQRTLYTKRSGLRNKSPMQILFMSVEALLMEKALDVERIIGQAISINNERVIRGKYWPVTRA